MALKTAMGAVVATVMATNASAALVSITGGTLADLPTSAEGNLAYDPQGASDPWPDAGALKGIAGLDLADDVRIDVTYRGKEARRENAVAFGSAGGFSTADSTPGVTITGLTKGQFEALTFNDRFKITSENVAVQAFGNVIEVGFNEASPGDADFDDLRFSALVATPIPVALPLTASGLAGLAWWSRRRRRGL